MSEIPETVRDYFKRIGARGGAAGRGTKLRRELSRKAAIIRWRKRHPRPKKISVDSRSAPA